MPVIACSGTEPGPVPARRRATGAAYLLVLVTSLLVAGPLAANTRTLVEDLESEVRELRERVIQLEQKLAAVLEEVKQDVRTVKETTAATQVLVRREAEPQKKPSVQLGGRVKLDAIYNSRTITQSSNTNQADLSFSPGNIPLDGTGETEQFNFSARETRLWVTANVPSAFGALGAHVEMDFFSADTAGNEVVTNSYVPRLRHAYANYAGFTAGQTWTTFMNVAAIPDQIDSGGPSGLVQARQPLLRYRHQQEWGTLSVALEQAESTLVNNAGLKIATDDERFPDLVGRLDLDGSWGNWSISALLREIRIDDGNNSDARWGAAVNASGRIYTVGADNIRFGLSYGNALGRYLSGGSFADGSIDARGDIKLHTMFGGFVAYQYWWSDTLRSNLSLGYSRADNHLGGIATVLPVEINRSLFSSHLDLLWSPVTAVTLGIEWIHGSRKLEDGRDGTLDRIQFSSLFSF